MVHRPRHGNSEVPATTCFYHDCPRCASEPCHAPVRLVSTYGLGLVLVLAPTISEGVDRIPIGLDAHRQRRKIASTPVYPPHVRPHSHLLTCPPAPTSATWPTARCTLRIMKKGYKTRASGDTENPHSSLLTCSPANLTSGSLASCSAVRLALCRRQLTIRNPSGPHGKDRTPRCHTKVKRRTWRPDRQTRRSARL